MDWFLIASPKHMGVTIRDQRFFSIPLVTEMFHFARSSSCTYEFNAWCSDLPSERVSPFGDLRIKGCLPPPRSFSQAATSFIVFWCRGIHRMLLFLFNHKKQDTRLLLRLTLHVFFTLFSFQGTVQHTLINMLNLFQHLIFEILE